VIPYVAFDRIPGPIPIAVFGLLVGTAVVVADPIFKRRVQLYGLDRSAAGELAWYAFAVGLVSAHLFSVLFYYPHELGDDPWLIARLWERVSSFGGMLGGALGAALYLHRKRYVLSVRQRWAFMDSVAFVTPFGWAIGRIGCSLVHDHPGRLTTFPLAISLATEEARVFIESVYVAAGVPFPASVAGLGFHDLGWYELLYLSLIVCPLFVWLSRNRAENLGRPPSWWVSTFVFLYAPARILLDFLRVGDARYAGLTPAQYAAIAMLVAAVYLRRNVARWTEPGAVG
jgi:phosphatidylglycerol:prolipoprotein diacylglycerol transferase